MLVPPCQPLCLSASPKRTSCGLWGDFAFLRMGRRVDPGHAPLADGFGHLPGRAADVAGGEDARYAGGLLFVGLDVAHVVVQADAQGCGQFHQAFGALLDENAGYGQGGAVLQFQALHLGGAEDGFDLGVFMDLDGAGDELLAQGVGYVQFFADQVHLGGDLVQGHGAVHGRAFPSHQGYFFILVEIAVAVHAIAHTSSQQIFFPGHPQFVSLGAGGHDQGMAEQVGIAFTADLEAVFHGCDLQYVLLEKGGTEIGGLHAACGKDFLAVDVEDAAEIFDMGMKQAAFGLFAHDQDRYVFAGRVDGGLKPGRAGSQDNDVVKLHVAHAWTPFGFTGLPPNGSIPDKDGHSCGKGNKKLRGRSRPRSRLFSARGYWSPNIALGLTVLPVALG